MSLLNDTAFRRCKKELAILCVYMTEREREEEGERGRERERETERERDRDRQTDRQTDRDRERQRGGDRQRCWILTSCQPHNPILSLDALAFDDVPPI